VSLFFLLLRLQSDQGLPQDIACIDQIDPDGKQRGINALPLIIAQCNAMISLADAYLTRSWCSVEVLMIQTLRDSYHVHEHWNYQSVGNGDVEIYRAETIPPVDDDLTGLKLSFPENDEPTVNFLVRQSQILAKS
jgi:hypothetical protein